MHDAFELELERLAEMEGGDAVGASADDGETPGTQRELALRAKAAALLLPEIPRAAYPRA